MGLGLAGVSFNLVLACLRSSCRSRVASAPGHGFGTAASSFGQFVFAPLTPFLVDLLGWKAALLIFSCVPLVIIPLSFALATSPGSGQGQGTGAEMSIAATLKQAFAHPSYVFLVIGFFTCGFQLAFITTHQLPDLPEGPETCRPGSRVCPRPHRVVQHRGVAGGWLARRPHVEALAARLHLFRRGAAVILLFVFRPRRRSRSSSPR